MTRSSVFIHPTATVHSDADIGTGTKIWDLAKVREGTRIGNNCIVGQGVYVDTGVIIGNACKIQNGVNIYNGVTIGDRVFVGPSATFTNDLYPRAHSVDWKIVPTVVEDGASIGANATIICGIRLGANCMVAAGAVVTRDVPAHGLVMGNPGRLAGYVVVDGRKIEAPPR